MQTRHQKKTKRKLRRGRIIITLAIIALIIGGIVYGNSFVKNLNQAEDKMLVTLPDQQKVSLSKSEPISILLLGLDERPPEQRVGELKNDIGRTDTMIIITINPKTKTTKMVSLPRDTRVKLDGVKVFQKVNAAYTFGEAKKKGSGQAAAIAQVESMFDIPINYVVQLNFEGFTSMIDAIGGITVDNPFEFTSDYLFPAGKVELDGAHALSYVRMRKEDADDDNGRTARQRMVMEEIIKKLDSFTVLTKFNEIFDVVGDNVKTNLTINEMLDLRKRYMSSTKNIEQIVMETTNASIDEVGDPYDFPLDYKRLSFEERIRITGILREQLGLEVKDISEYSKNEEENSDPEIVEGDENYDNNDES